MSRDPPLPDWIEKPPPRIAEAYRDDSFPERACDHCGKPYRGPAVYCSFKCAILDANTA